MASVSPVQLDPMANISNPPTSAWPGFSGVTNDTTTDTTLMVATAGGMSLVSREEFERLANNLDDFFLIVNGMLVYMMQCGFAFLEAGCVRSKNTTNILIKNLLDSFIAGIAYWVFGWAFAFGEGNVFIGYHYFTSDSMPKGRFAMFFFQYVFAATASTIVSGAVAERCEFITYLVYSFVISGFIYPVVTHWAWFPGGWLALGREYDIDGSSTTLAYQDFAGSGVVHIVGGAASLAGAFLLGPRIGRFHSDHKKALDLRGHSVPLAALGGFILLFGFLAFNGGSELEISRDYHGDAVSIAVVNTIISASFSAFTTLLIQKTGIFGNSSWSLLVTLNGALTGMVSVCAGCNKIYPWGAALLGFIASITYKITAWWVVKLRIDDPLDAVAVHFGGGTWGVIAVAFLDRETGILLNWNRRSGLKFAWQLVGMTSIALWSGVLCFIMFGILRLLGLLRVSEEIEKKGLDIPKHGEPSYPLESYGHGHIEKLLRILESGQLGLVNQGFVDLTDEMGPELIHQPGYETPETHAMQNGKGVQSIRGFSRPSHQKAESTNM